MIKPEAIATTQHLVRPCVLLKREGLGAVAALWGGPGTVQPPEGPYRHWISIDCQFLPEGLGPTAGVLSVYTNEDDCVCGIVRHDATARLPLGQGVPLFAHPGRSLPPPNALADLDAQAYTKLWQSNCPLYTEEATAVLGGWHFPWPDDDWNELRELPLLLWTIEDSEPWVEVWGGAAGYRVMQRIT